MTTSTIPSVHSVVDKLPGYVDDGGQPSVVHLAVTGELQLTCLSSTPSTEVGGRVHAVIPSFHRCDYDRR